MGPVGNATFTLLLGDPSWGGRVQTPPSRLTQRSHRDVSSVRQEDRAGQCVQVSSDLGNRRVLRCLHCILPSLQEGTGFGEVSLWTETKANLLAQDTGTKKESSRGCGGGWGESQSRGSGFWKKGDVTMLVSHSLELPQVLGSHPSGCPEATGFPSPGTLAVPTLVVSFIVQRGNYRDQM